MVWMISGYIIYFIRRRGKKRKLSELSEIERKEYKKEELKDILISVGLGFVVAFAATLLLATG